MSASRGPEAAVTPARRDRYIDLLRAASICVVVLGHWAVWDVWVDDDGLRGTNLLSVASWTHPVTWLFQVVPVFLLVGGYANAASLAAQRRKGRDTASWVRQRALRLLRPSVVFIAVLLGVRLVAVPLGFAEEPVRAAIWLAAGPLWFLVVYLAVVVLAPVAEAAHRRWGLRVLVVLVAGVLIGDLLRLASGHVEAAGANFLFAWGAVHQAGIAWRDGALPRTKAGAWVLIGGGLAMALLLTGPGPYGVAMVGAATAPDLTNTAPPTIALLALATAQTGVVLLARGPVTSWLARPRVWTGVVALNSVILTVFLWHMTALMIAFVTLGRPGLFPQPPVGSGEWLALRIPWLAVFAVVLAGLVALMGRWERPLRRDAEDRASPLGVGVGVVGVLAGLASLGLSDTRGFAPQVAGIPVVELALIAGGLVVLTRAGRGGPRPHPDAQG